MKENIFAAIPDALPDELSEILARREGVIIERIVSRAHSSAPDFWYDQDHDEFVILLRGTATLRFRPDEGTVELSVGDYLLIPAHRKHRVESTSSSPEAVWLAVHLPPNR